MSPAELKALAANFKDAIPLDHGHPTTDGPIDFGRLESVEASPDGTTLYGTTATPAWLDKALGDARWLVSASFDRATKAIRRLSLVTRPQISDAELQAAFACACGHDEAKAETPTTKERPAMTKREQANAKLDAMADDEREGVLDAILADAPDDDDDDASEGETSDFSADEDPEKAELRARLDTLERERREERAASFAAGEVAAHRILPHEETHAAAVMFQALADDAIDGATVNFSAGGKTVRGTREAVVRAAYAQRKPHEWTEEKVASFAARGRALDNGGGGETEEQRKARLKADLQSTVSGRAALAEMNGTV